MEYACDELARNAYFPLISIVFAFVMIWDGVWKLIALWHAARRGEKIWFFVLALVNSLGIVPLIYLTLRTDFFGKSKKSRRAKRK